MTTKTIAFVAHKGGAGKTSSAVTLADELGRRGYSTLLIDLDPQANASLHIGKENPYEIAVTSNQVLLSNTSDILQSAIHESVLENVSLIYGSLPRAGQDLEMRLMFDSPRPNEALKHKVDILQGVFDVIIIDTPPTLGLRTKNALAAATHTIIPVEASGQYGIYGIADMVHTINEIRLINPQLTLVGALMNRFDKRRSMCTLIENQAKAIVGSVIPVRIGETTKMNQAAAFKQSIRQLARTHSVTKDYSDLAEWMIQQCGIEQSGGE